MLHCYIVPEDTIISEDDNEDFEYNDFEYNDFEYNDQKEKLLKVFTYALKIPDQTYRILSTDDKYVITNEEYVVKINFNIDEKFDDINESFIGIYGTNKLKIPYFAKIEGILFDEYYLGEKCNMVYYEYIKGPTLKQFIMENDYSKVILILEQLFIALYYANRKIGFTHYDLHYNNIIIKKLPDITEIKIPFDNEYKYFMVDYIPVIIDYEFSNINYHNINYGRLMPEGNIENRPFWIHDVFKLLMNIYYITSLDVHIMTKDNKINNMKNTVIILENQNFLNANNKVIDRFNIKIKDLKNVKENLIQIYENNPNLEKINRKIRKYLSFFTGYTMTPEMYIEFHKTSYFYNLKYKSDFDEINFKDFINFL